MIQSGDRFGNYTVVRRLGKGGMGAVYLLEAADTIQIFVKAERQMYDQSSIVLATHQGFDMSPAVMPIMKLRGCSYFDALDIVCQSVDFTFTVDKRVTIKTKTLADEQRKNEEARRANAPLFSDDEIDGLRRMPPNLAVQKGEFTKQALDADYVNMVYFVAG